MAALAALLIAGCAASPVERLGGPDAILERFREIHPQVYRVYSLGLNRDAIHDQLSSVFAGEALTREYVEHFTTLARMREEGTAIDVLAVDYESVAIAGTEPEGVLVEADWSVGGVVSHQQHKHHRVNRYQAIYTLALAGGSAGEPPALRIVDTRLRSAERVGTPLTSTGGFPLDHLPASERGFMGPAELLRSGILDDAASPPSPTGSADADADTAAVPAARGPADPAEPARRDPGSPGPPNPRRR
ncbi:MAG TPA: hypothetical protein VMS86_06720 [Thermoanaerobaculia bacterium]|nr:hypothetical protein [Thermoanaerobaculia bacterium]